MLVRLFLARESVPLAIRRRRARGDRLWASLPRAGLLAVRDGVVRTRFALEPFRRAHRRVGPAPRAGCGTDHVLQIGPATRTLAALDRAPSGRGRSRPRNRLRRPGVPRRAPQRARRRRRPERRAHSASRGSTRPSTASRTSTGGEGDLFEPVGDEQFGLVAANPALRRLPRARAHLPRRRPRRRRASRARRSRERRDTCTKAGSPASSAAGSPSPGANSLATPRRWLEGSGCDILVLELASDSPVTYAMRWNSLPGRRPEAAATAAEPWLADYRARGIEAISTGAIVLRKRRAGKNWARFDELGIAPRGDAGATHREDLRRPGSPTARSRRARGCSRWLWRWRRRRCSSRGDCRAERSSVRG